ncbi:MAG: AAA family ATPase, partial [Bacteroidaceae bacterium]|nr:AAA family ATPase [Bacteroidaceae bacterium]
MKRFITQKLEDWKQSKNRKPLVLLGARQVGKTWIMKDFGKNHYENVAYVNCDEEP